MLPKDWGDLTTTLPTPPPCPLSFPQRYPPQHPGLLITTCTLFRTEERRHVSSLTVSVNGAGLWRTLSGRSDYACQLWPLQSWSCYIYLSSVMLEQEDSLQEGLDSVQGTKPLNESAQKIVHFPIKEVLHLLSKFYLNTPTLVKYCKV